MHFLKFLQIFTYFILLLINSSNCGFFDYLINNSVCRVTECCNNDYIPMDIEKLEKNLREKLFGQHIVIEELIPALKSHYFYPEKRRPGKPLVLSFNGTPGTGKTMVVNEIINAVYTLGVQSQYVKLYNGRAAFPLVSQVEAYNVDIHQALLASVMNKCNRNMFIFNEVHKMPAGIFETLSSWVDYGSGKTDISEYVFIFIGNTAGVEISDQLGHLMKIGTLRETTKLHDFEGIIRRSLFNLEGGFKKTGLIKSHVVDHFIPFLPLEVSHVHLCIEQEFKAWHYHSNIELVDRIIQKSVTLDSTHGLFSASGCKGLDKNVALEVTRNIKTEL